jgi:hypothetical protein
MATKKKQEIAEMAAVANASAREVVIKQPEQKRIVIEVEGVTPLIQNKFSQKAIEEMLRKHMGISVQRERKKPRELLEAACIRNVKGDIVIPPVAFKSAMCSAADGLKNIKMAQIKRRILVEGEGVPITYRERIDRMDMVRTSGMTRAPDVRFRPSFYGWKARLSIRFTDVMSVETVLDLLARAGGLGVGEWRTERGGTFGQFRIIRNISSAKEIAEVMESCAIPMPAPVIPEWARDIEFAPGDLGKLFDVAEDAEEESEAPIAANSRKGR